MRGRLRAHPRASFLLRGLLTARSLRRANWPIALAVLFVALLAWYLLYTERIVEALRANAATLSQIYSRVQEGIGRSGSRGGGDHPLRAPGDHSGVGRTLGLDRAGRHGSRRREPPLHDRSEHSRRAGPGAKIYAGAWIWFIHPWGTPASLLLHFGDPPEVRGLQWIPWFQVGGFLLTAVLGIVVIRSPAAGRGREGVDGHGQGAGSSARHAHLLAAGLAGVVAASRGGATAGPGAG